jgi:hypothetical protein
VKHNDVAMGPQHFRTATLFRSVIGTSSRSSDLEVQALWRRPTVVPSAVGAVGSTAGTAATSTVTNASLSSVSIGTSKSGVGRPTRRCPSRFAITSVAR